MTNAASHDKTLIRVVARTCRRRTLVLTPSQAAISFTSRSLEVRAITPDALGKLDETETFDTVVLLGVLEGLAEPAGDALVDAAWTRLEPRGRFIVCVANEESGSHPQQLRHFSARSLRHLLRAKGRPKVVTEQPFRWLVMYVDRRRSRQARTPAGRLARFRVISRLCRGRVIELGCGAGELTAAIGARGLDVLGVDLNRAKIETARERYPHLRFEQEDICRTSAPPASFDTVVLAEVLEHVTDAVGARMLATAWGLLRPGGRLIVSVPNENCIPHPNHIRAFTRDSFRELLEPLGRPRLVTDQPYKWLLMYVNKPAGMLAVRPEPALAQPQPAAAAARSMSS